MPAGVRMPGITFVVARSRPGDVIGRDGALPWRLAADLRRFRRVTVGHAVVMGRTTHESIGRPLPERMNVVLSTGDRLNHSDLFWAHSRDTATAFADLWSILSGRDRFFVIGGGSVYRLYDDVFDEVVLTEVVTGPISGDAHFRRVFEARDWETVSEERVEADAHNEFPFQVRCLRRRAAIPRFRSPEDLRRLDPAIAEWLERFGDEVAPGRNRLEECIRALSEP